MDEFSLEHILCTDEVLYAQCMVKLSTNPVIFESLNHLLSIFEHMDDFLYENLSQKWRVYNQHSH